MTCKRIDLIFSTPIGALYDSQSELQQKVNIKRNSPIGFHEELL